MMDDMPPSRDHQWRYFASLMGGEPAFLAWLADQRKGHQSYEGIAYAIQTKTDEWVSASTVRRWCLTRLIGSETETLT